MSHGCALITGGAGFIGSHLAQELLAQGYHVRILDNLLPQVHGPDRRVPSYLDPRVEFVCGDVRNREDVVAALEDVDFVFHLAALTGVGQSMYVVDEYIRTNVGGTATLLQCLIDCDLKPSCLVLASSRAVYGEGKYRCACCGVVYPCTRSVGQLDQKEWELACPFCGGMISSLPTDEASRLNPGSIYAASKRMQEDLVFCVGKAYGFPFVILRYFNIYGPHQSPANPYTGLLITFLSRLMQGRPLELFEDGQMLRDFVHVRDVATVTAAAIHAPKAFGQAINVGSGQAITVESLAKSLLKLVQVPVEIQHVAKSRVGDIRHIVADIQRARQILKYKPRVSFQEGIAEVFSWLQDQELYTGRSEEARGELEQRHLFRG